MHNWKNFLQIPLLLAAMSTAHAAFAQQPQPPANSAESSKRSDIPAGKVLTACSAAADELAASRKLIEALELENTALKARLETERRTTALLGELDETRRSETEALRLALAAKNEAIAAKDAVIASQDKLIETLKRKKSSPWRRLGDALLGAAIFALLK